MTRRWIEDSVGAEALEQLAAGLAGSELSSVLLEVMQRRAAARTPADVLAQYQRDRFCHPAVIDPRVSLDLDRHLFAAADGFDAIELSPVAPLATCSSVGPTAQNRVLSALRSTEIVADPTNVLALECALRLRAGAAAVHLATSQRVIRTQPVPKLPGFAQHFRIFVLASGGIEAKDHAFTVDAIERHIRTMLAALDRLEAHGYAFGARRVDLLATPARAALADRIAGSLGGVAVERKPLDHPYYSAGLRYMLWVTAPDGAELPLIDGGAFDWLATLSANRRAAYIASGGGSQLIAFRFRAR
ncbi:MAG TPA: hypothetical protein VHW23_41940 [Kofleriaceae bacterium]|jgi:hypothetical protein|nr:hypothetical protein [Kofleriaceae bacterium]